jgi:hypothetical protein
MPWTLTSLGTELHRSDLPSDTTADFLIATVGPATRRALGVVREQSV